MNNLFYYTTCHRLTTIILPETIGQQININENALKQFILQNAKKYKRFLCNIIILDEVNVKKNKYKNISLCSDGGGKDNTGSIGIVFDCLNKVLVELSSRIPQVYEELHLHGSECYGILVGVKILLRNQQNMIQIKNQALEPHRIIL
jgi:hypothetical protein